MPLLLDSSEQFFILWWKLSVNVAISAKTPKEAHLLACPAAAVYSGIQCVIPSLRAFYERIRWRLAAVMRCARTTAVSCPHTVCYERPPEEVLLVPRRLPMRTLTPTLARVLPLLGKDAAEERRAR